jgi:hypothetical protein
MEAGERYTDVVIDKRIVANPNKGIPSTACRDR